MTIVGLRETIVCYRPIVVPSPAKATAKCCKCNRAFIIIDNFWLS